MIDTHHDLLNSLISGGLCGATSEIISSSAPNSSSNPTVAPILASADMQTSPPSSAMLDTPKNPYETTPTLPTSPAAHLGLKFSTCKFLLLFFVVF